MAISHRTYKDISFKRYFEEKYAPAQRWAKSGIGQSWITEHCDTLSASILQAYDDVRLYACYSLIINGKDFYIGQSIKPANRVHVLLHDLATTPELFGLEADELEELRISVNILSKRDLYSEEERKEWVEYYITQLDPLLQLPSGRCVSHRRRRAAVEQWRRETRSRNLRGENIS